MTRRAVILCLLTFLAGGVWYNPAHAQFRPFAKLFGSKSKDHGERSQAIALVPMERLSPAARAKVERVLEQPTLYTKGPAETFVCKPNVYHWLLDNPDRNMVAWRRLGAKCIEITNRGNGVFGWSDDQGSEVTWSTVYPGPNLRIWYAEGQVKPGPLLPMIPVQCVVILQNGVVQPLDKGALMHQQCDVFVRTDSRAAGLATRLLGPSVPRMAEEAAAQMQMFFAAMAWYCHQHPEKMADLFRPATRDEPASSRVMSPFQFQPSSGAAAAGREE